MRVSGQLKKNLVDPEKHGPILEALVDILEADGETGVKKRIKTWIQEILAEEPPPRPDEG